MPRQQGELAIPVVVDDCAFSIPGVNLGDFAQKHGWSLLFQRPLHPNVAIDEVCITFACLCLQMFPNCLMSQCTFDAVLPFLAYLHACRRQQVKAGQMLTEHAQDRNFDQPACLSKAEPVKMQPPLKYRSSGFWLQHMLVHLKK